MEGKYRIYKGRNGKHYWQLKASNGQVILQSQAYASKSSAEDGIASVRKNCKSNKCYDLKKAKNGQHYFNLMATNGQVIGTSETYKRPSSARNGIESVMRNGKTKRVDDETS